MPIVIPPIKSQGIKTKLVPWINDIISKSGLDQAKANWIEPFFGTGVVGLNATVGGVRYVGDSNPHIINLYNGILHGDITSGNVRQYLEREGELLSQAGENGYAHYRKIKDRFNSEFGSFDFLFLSRAGFNGMMRFNSQGKWNIPFCKKPNRFSPAYITKICNQVAATQRIVWKYGWGFHNQGFLETINMAGEGDLIYCDPPYLGRSVDYYNGWTEDDEKQLYLALKSTSARFVLSTWHHNEFRTNVMVDKLWGNFNVVTREHFYQAGAHLDNRHPMVEALVFNFELCTEKPKERQLQFDFA